MNAKPKEPKKAAKNYRSQSIMLELSVAQKLKKDLITASIELSDSEVRYLVDAYYMYQEDRKRSDNQMMALHKAEEPNAIVSWLGAQSESIEGQIKKALDKYTDNNPVGVWLKGITGIGAVISAGLLAHIDIKKAPTVGHIWNFAGLSPDIVWSKGEKRPFNASLKTLCWKIGQSFMKFSNNENCFYGKLYKEKKAYYVAKNEAGDYKEDALKKADKVRKTTEAYKYYSAGKLPPAQIDARARRYAVKLFLAHFHEVYYKFIFKQDPPKPYPIAILGHAHKIEPLSYIPDNE